MKRGLKVGESIDIFDNYRIVEESSPMKRGLKEEPPLGLARAWLPLKSLPR